MSRRPPRIVAGENIDNKRRRTDNENSDSVEAGSERIFLGTILSGLPQVEVIERRTIETSSAMISRGLDGWYYQIETREHELGSEDRFLMELALKKLEDHADLDTKVLLSDQRLARELVRTAAKSAVPRLKGLDSQQAAEIISSYSVGFGPIEWILKDDLVEDVIISSPSSRNCVHVLTKLSESDERSIFCKTNLRLTEDYLASIVTKVRIFYGGELSIRRPILEVDVPYLRSRFSIVAEPASRHGTSMSIRRRREFLWTLPRLIRDGSISWTAAGFLSICCVARASMIIAGGRGSGKTTLLSALLPELPASGRIIAMEDTEELPILSLQREGVKVQSLSLEGGLERACAIMRASLRMGEGPLVVGEIRGEEARILFESIRIGTAGSSVLGTLHASDPSSVRDRISMDMGLKEETFRAIDLIVISRQRNDPMTGLSRRYVSEICLVSGNDEPKALFKEDDDGFLKTCPDGFQRMENLGRKISSNFDIDEDAILRASRIRGFMKKVQAGESQRKNDETIIGVTATLALNDIRMSYRDEPDWGSLKDLVIGSIRRERER